jgi:hypothetical protein
MGTKLEPLLEIPKLNLVPLQGDSLNLRNGNSQMFSGVFLARWILAAAALTRA